MNMEERFLAQFGDRLDPGPHLRVLQSYESTAMDMVPTNVRQKSSITGAWLSRVAYAGQKDVACLPIAMHAEHIRSSIQTRKVSSDYTFKLVSAG